MDNIRLYEQCFAEVVTMLKVLGYTEDDIRSKYMWVVDHYYEDKLKDKDGEAGT